MKNKLMTHLVCGYPSLEESEKLLNVLSKYSKYVEVQFPFSDPIADWKIIANANEIAIKNWVTIKNCFDFLEYNIKNVDSKIIIMTYYNIVYNYNTEKFIKKAKDIWVFGLIIPDIPFDEVEWQELINLCSKYDINLIQVVSPNCNNDRLKKTFSNSSWLIYAVSQNMTTWNKINLWESFEKYINNLRNFTSLEIWVWFWIKTKDDIEKVLKVADIAIIWSEILKIYNENWIVWIEKFLHLCLL